MIEKNLKIALAESMTCGLATHQLNIVKGDIRNIKRRCRLLQRKGKNRPAKCSPGNDQEIYCRISGS